AAPLAGARRHHLAENALAHAADLTRPAALGAHDRLGVPTGTRATTLFAALRESERDRDLCPEHRLDELEVGDDLHVLAARRSAGAAPCSTSERSAPTAEEGVEQVAEPATEPAVGAPAGT